MARIILDRDKCTALGICESIAPDHFEVNDDGDLEILEENVNTGDLQTVEEACAGCPTEALRIER